MKVFYRKDNTNQVKEITLYSRNTVDSKVEVMMWKSTADDELKPVMLLHKEYDKAEYLRLFRLLKAKLESNGWKESYEEIMESEYSTFADGKIIPSKVAKYIDPFEEIEDLANLTLPMYMFGKPNGYQDTYYDGEFRNLKVAASSKLLSKAKYVFATLRVPFHCFVSGDDLIVYDVMIPHYPYSVRLNIITQLGAVKFLSPAKYTSTDELFKDYKVFSKLCNEVYLVHSENIYSPGTAMQHSYIVAAGDFDEAIVLDVQDKQALCINYDFDSLFQVETTELQPMDIITYRENDTVTISI